MFDITHLKPEIIIQGGAVLVALYALWNNRRMSSDQGIILKNHMKHHEDKDDEDIGSRNRLASAIQKLTDKIEQFHEKT